MIPDHPTIKNCENTGYPDGRELQEPVCPVCGRVCETVYYTAYGDVFACDNCVDSGDAWDEPMCF